MNHQRCEQGTDAGTSPAIARFVAILALLAQQGNPEARSEIVNPNRGLSGSRRLQPRPKVLLRQQTR
jgi:hypothetical protein